MSGKITLPAVLISVVLLAGCAVVLIGAGVGAGAYTYVKGELTRSYAADYNRTLKVCTGIIKDLGQPIVEKTTDGAQTTIQTTRKDGTPQTIKVVILSPDRTQVAVRTGVVGYWKKDISMQFQEFVFQRLQK